MGSSEMTGGVDSDGSVSWEDFFGTSTDLVPQLLGMFDELARKDQFNNNINDQIPSSIQKRLSLVAVNSQRNTIFGQICTGKMEQSQSSAMQQQQQQQQQHQQQNHDINCIIPSLDKRSSPFSPLLLPSRRAPPPPPPPPPLPPLPHNSSCSITSSTVSFLYPKVEITVSDNNNNENEIKNSQNNNNNNNNEKNHTILNDNNNEDDIDNVDEDDNHEDDDDDDDDKNINKLTTPKYGGRRKNNNNNIINNNNNNNGNIDRPLSGSSISSSSTSSSGCSNQGTTRSVNPYLTSVESLADTCASSQGSGDSGVVTKSDTNCRIINDDNLIVSSSHITTMNSSPQFMFHRARYCDPQRNSVEKVLLEIVDTEAIYVEHIRQIIQGYLIYWRNNKITLLNDNELNNLFSNIEDIYKFNYKFLGEIENCGLDPVKVANIFIKNNSGFKVYTEYCTNYPRTVETLTNLMGHDDTANEFRERQASLCHALPLGSFLLKPVQRILKYHLLLESLSREYDTLKINNQNNNINYDNDIYLQGQKSIDDALNGMMDIAKHINAMKRKHEHAVRVQEIQSLLYGWAGPDLTTYGELIAEGRFRMRGAKAPRHAFLFDKMLLLTKKKEDGLLVYKAHIMCSNLMLIESIPGEACSFHVIPFDNPRLQYTLQARNTEQKREWTLQIKRVMLENYNAVIPVHAQELVLQIGQNQNNNDNINTNCDKISMKKQYSSPPEYLERRKQDKERRRSEAGQKIKKLLKTETADNSPLSIRKLTIDNNDNDNDNNNLHDKSLNRSLDSRSSKVKDRFTNWRRKSEPGFQSYISLNQSDDEHTDNNNNNNINDDIEVAMDALNYDDVIDNNDKQNDDDDDDNNNNKNNTKDTNEQINNNNNNNNSSRTVEEIVGHILYMQNKEFQKLLEKQRNNSMTNNVRQQRGYNKNHNSIDTSDDSDNPETDISSINNSLLSINKQNNKKNIKRTIRKDKRLLKSNNCWNSLESSTQNKYNNLQKNDNNNNNTQIIDNNNIVNIKKNNVTEKKQIFESFKKQNIITDSKIIKTALRIRDNSLYDDDDDDEDEDEDEEEDDDNNMTNSDLSLTNKSFGNYDNLENIWNNYDNKKQDTNSPTAIWLTKLCDDLPTSPQKCGSLPRSFQINPSSQMMITKRLLQRDGKPMSERPFTIASDKPAEINLEDMERYATTYQPKDIIAKFPLSSSSTITCSYSIDDNLTDANHMKVIETDIHPDHKIYRENNNNNNNNNNNKFKNVLTKASNRLQVLRSTVSAETLEIIDDYNNTKLTKRNNNNKEKNKKNKFKLSRESSIDDIDETNLSTINLQHSSLYYKQGSSCLGARIAQSDYADPSVLFFDLKKINLSTNESTNSNNNIIETKITTNANDKNDNSIDDVDVKKINERNPSETDSFYERCFEKIENYADNIADTSYVVDADVDTDDVFRDSAIFSDIDDSNLIVKNNKTFNDNIIKIKTKITQPTPPPVPIKIRKSKPCIARKPDNLKMKVKVIKKCELVPPQCVRVKVSSTNQSQSGNVGKLINGGSVDEISAGQSQAGWVKKIVGQLQGQN